MDYTSKYVRMHACAMIYGGPAVADVARPPSASLIDPKEQRNCYSLVPFSSHELPERGCRQQRTTIGAPTPDFSSRFTPETFSMTGWGRKAAEVLNQMCSFS